MRILNENFNESIGWCQEVIVAKPTSLVHLLVRDEDKDSLCLFCCNLIGILQKVPKKLLWQNVLTVD